MLCNSEDEFEFKHTNLCREDVEAYDKCLIESRFKI